MDRTEIGDQDIVVWNISQIKLLAAAEAWMVWLSICEFYFNTQGTIDDSAYVYLKLLLMEQNRAYYHNYVHIYSKGILKNII